MRRGLAVLLLIAFMLSAGGCGQSGSAAKTSPGRLQIVCTIFPIYDWVKEILGERADEVEVTLLMKNGADLHSYQPTLWDMKKIAEADLFLYVGGESDFWVEDVLSNLEGKGHALNLVEILGYRVMEEMHLEGMQKRPGEEEHEHGEAEYDEHVWLSLRNAEEVCQAIAETLCELEEEYAGLYGENLRAYKEKLDALDREYQKVTKEREAEPVLLFGDRFPFRYLAEDYGLTCYAAFAGCSAETEASFSTITFLAGKAGELKLPVILSIDGSDQKISRTIASNTSTRDQKVLVLDSMQSVSEDDIENGESYLGIMERNLEVLKEALGAAMIGTRHIDTEL